MMVAAPGSGRQAVVPMLLDSGADCSLLPGQVVRALELPWIDWLTIEGVGSRPHRAGVYAAELAVGSRRTLVRVVAFGNEGLLGRDWMSGVRLGLDGPGLRLSIDRRAGASRRR
jgi:hypothetical protein